MGYKNAPLDPSSFQSFFYIHALVEYSYYFHFLLRYFVSVKNQMRLNYGTPVIFPDIVNISSG